MGRGLGAAANSIMCHRYIRPALCAVVLRRRSSWGYSRVHAAAILTGTLQLRSTSSTILRREVLEPGELAAAIQAV